jgi:EAL domain-containing protein (putative c-di-GMP-specific phosphodiesterase class I)
VETVEQMRSLQTAKRDGVQGYLFSRPVPTTEMTQMR